MAIDIFCHRCGNVFRVDDSLAGKRVPCSVCRYPTKIPREDGEDEAWPSNAGHPPGFGIRSKRVTEAEIEEVQVKRPFWRDPVVVVGAAIPSIIIAVFLTYIWMDSSSKTIREGVARDIAEAHALHKQNDIRAAQTLYLRVAAVPKGYGAQTDDAIEDARANRVTLGMQIHLDDERIASEKRREADRQEREDRRLAISAEIRGDVWIEFKDGRHQSLRGLEIELLPAAIPRPEAAAFLREVRRRALVLKGLALKHTEEDVYQAGKNPYWALSLEYDKCAKEAEELATKGKESPIHLSDIHRLAAVASPGDERDRAIKNPVWAEILGSAAVSHAESTVEGKYSFRDIHAGEYLIYAIHANEIGLAEWLIPVAVTRSGSITLDIHNRKATLLLNKKAA